MDVSVTELKQKAPKLFDSLSDEIIITKRGKAIAKIVPIEKTDTIKAIPGGLKNTLVEMEDIVSPIDERWDACGE